MTPEGKIVAFIRRRVKAMGGLVRKCSWEGHAGAPDLLVMLSGRHFWVECKAPGEKPRPIQIREIELMKSTGGCEVYVCDSLEAFNAVLEAPHE